MGEGVEEQMVFCLFLAQSLCSPDWPKHIPVHAYSLAHACIHTGDAHQCKHK